MEVILKTPNGTITATVDSGFIANAQVDPDGVVTIGFYPLERPPDDVETIFISD